VEAETRYHPSSDQLALASTIDESLAALPKSQPKGLEVPVEIVPDQAILGWEAGNLARADFLKKENDPALKDTGWEQELSPK